MIVPAQLNKWQALRQPGGKETLQMFHQMSNQLVTTIFPSLK